MMLLLQLTTAVAFRQLYCRGEYACALTYTWYGMMVTWTALLRYIGPVGYCKAVAQITCSLGGGRDNFQRQP